MTTTKKTATKKATKPRTASTPGRKPKTLEDYQKENAILRSTIRENGKIAEQEQAAVEGLIRDLEKARLRISALEAERDNIGDEHRRVMAERDALRDEVRDTEQTMAELRAGIEAYQSEHHRFDETISTLRKSLDERDRALECTKAQVRALERALCIVTGNTMPTG